MEIINDQPKQLALLHSLVLATSKVRQIDDLAEIVIGHTVRAVAPDVVFFFLIENNQLVLLKNWQYPGGISSITHEGKKIGVCLCGKAAEQGTPVYSLNIHNDARCTLNECKAAGLQSFAAIPLLDESYVVGLLCVGAFEKRDFKEDAEFLEILGNHVSIVLANFLANKKLDEQLSRMQTHVESLREKEAALLEKERLLTESQRIAHIGNWRYEVDGRLEWTEETYRVYGVTPESFTLNSESFLHLIHPDDRAAMAAWIAACLAGEKPGELEFRIVLADGSVRFISGWGELKYDDLGRPSYMAGTAQEITERKKAQEALRESEERLRAIFDNTSEGILLGDPETKKLSYGNKMICQMLGYSPEEIKTLTIFDIHPAEHLPYVLKQFEGQAKGEITLAVNMPVKRKDGSVFYADINASPLVFAGRKHITGFFTDITARRKAENLLREAELKFSSLVQSASDAIITADESSRISTWNLGAERIFGYAEAEVIGQPLALLMPERYQADHYKGMRRIIKTGESQYLGKIMEFHGMRKDGTEFPLELSVNAWPTMTGMYFLGIIRDITQRRKIETALQESQERLRTIIDSEPQCVKLITADGDLLEMNPAGLAMIEADSFAQVNGQSLFPLLAPAHRQTFAEHIARVFAGQTETLEFELIGLKGTHRWLATHSTPYRNGQGAIIALLGITRDITEQRKLEEQLRHAQKLEGIGQLAGGIAHDFNNILNAVIGFSGLAQMNIADQVKARGYLNEVIAAGQRGASLTHQLLAFSRKQVLDMKPVDLNTIIANLMKLLLRLIREDIKLTFIPARADIVVLADGSQLDQVLINLVTNARDAMPKGGEIDIATDLVLLDSEFIQLHGVGATGPYALISVRDNGAGMDKEIRSRIFEPFFTTKEVGKGTGLGLAVVYGIVRQHNGYINVDSEPGSGTVFSVYLPIAETRGRGKEAPTQAPLFVGGPETILVADDDEPLRRLLQALLETAGYSVILADNGTAAIAAFQEKKEQIKLVLLDAIMPQKNGWEAYEEISRLAPDVKTIFLSGYASDVFYGKTMAKKDIPFLTKPILPGDLLRKIRDVLDGQ